jgi:glucose-6-phosphate dehydrogenase assembly protein OpcA
MSPDRILRELSELWVGLAQQSHDEAQQSRDREGAVSSPGVLRACTMTLLVLAEESDDMSALGETIAALMPEHPARAILIRLHADGPRSLSERVYAQCWMPFGQRRQICCEQVEITVSDAALADLPSVVLPLAVADLPVVLWCRAPRLIGMPEFRAIASMATRVLVDSAAMPDAADALRRLAAATHRTVLGDLAWTRLTRWREMLAQLFQNRELLAQIPAIRNVTVRFGPGYETSARYLAAWICDAIGRTNPTVAPDPATPTLQLELSGEALRIELHREAQRLVATVNDLSQCTNLPQPGDYILMREELAISGRDPAFERTLASAAQ